MLKTYLYLPEELNNQITLLASTQNKSKAEIIRRALKKGIAPIQKRQTSSADALLKIAKIGKKYNLHGPKDGSEKMDEYLWGKDWSKNEQTT